MKRTIQALCIIAAMFLISKIALAGPTIVEGDVSGTWDLAGSPYYVINDCTVPQGQILTIEPGVTIAFYNDMSLIVNGQIIAAGEPDKHIVFKAVNESFTWKNVKVKGYGSNPPTSEFVFCDFENAQKALYLYIQGHTDNSWTIMQTNISNCNFAQSVDTAIFGEAYGRNIYQFGTPRRRHAKLNPIIDSCFFQATNRGIELFIHGSCSTWCGGASSDPIICNNIFNGLSETAFIINEASHCSGSPEFMNNTINNCNSGIITTDPFDVKAKNNIFIGCVTAVERVGSLNSTVYFNCFYNNTTDFAGYPASYGDPILTNVNGDPCDIGFNIFLDSLFAGVSNFHLTRNSPCINAGTSEDAPSEDMDGDSRPQGSGLDIGADEFFVMDLVANAGPDQIICSQLCDAAVLDGRKSYALNSVIESYDWELLHRDDAGYNQTATGDTPTVLNLATGIYDVTLIVTDDADFQATDQMILTVIEICNGCSIMKGDLDSDGDVDGDDLKIFSQNYGTVVLTP